MILLEVVERVALLREKNFLLKLAKLFLAGVFRANKGLKGLVASKTRVLALLVQILNRLVLLIILNFFALIT